MCDMCVMCDMCDMCDLCEFLLFLSVSLLLQCLPTNLDNLIKHAGTPRSGEVWLVSPHHNTGIISSHLKWLEIRGLASPQGLSCEPRQILISTSNSCTSSKWNPVAVDVCNISRDGIMCDDRVFPPPACRVTCDGIITRLWSHNCHQSPQVTTSNFLIAHITHHTFTHHISHITYNTSHITHSHITYHTSYITYHTPHIRV